MLSFSKRVDALEKEMCEGRVGCSFIPEIAKNGGVDYIRAPRMLSPASRFKYVAALERFACDSRKRILALLPTEEPETFDEGRKLSLNLFAETHACLGSANTNTMIKFGKTLEKDDPRFWEITDLILAEGDRIEPDLLRIVHQPKHADALCNSFVTDDRFKPRIFDPVSFRMEDLLPIAVAPYYTPLTDQSHPHWSPCYAFMMNYWKDIFTVIDDPSKREQVRSVRQWSRESVGFKYAHGMHIDHPPKKMTDARRKH